MVDIYWNVIVSASVFIVIVIYAVHETRKHAKAAKRFQDKPVY